jgi:hypothetical protein
MIHTISTTTFHHLILAYKAFYLSRQFTPSVDESIKEIPPAKVHGGIKYRLPAPGTAPQRDTLAFDHGGIRPRLLVKLSTGSSGAIFSLLCAPILNFRSALCSASCEPTPPLHRFSRNIFNFQKLYLLIEIWKIIAPNYFPVK